MNHSVHPSEPIVLGDRVRVWYMAEGYCCRCLHDSVSRARVN